MVEPRLFVLALVLTVTAFYVAFYFKFWLNVVQETLDEYERMAEEGELEGLDSGGGLPWT